MSIRTTEIQQNVARNSMSSNRVLGKMMAFIAALHINITIEQIILLLNAKSSIA
jgi:hypothetical protein